jgi:ferredoxin
VRVRVIEERCQGHTLCNAVAPDIFKLRDEDGHAYVEAAELHGEAAELARKAELGCPERAIEITE